MTAILDTIIIRAVNCIPCITIVMMSNSIINN